MMVSGFFVLCKVVYHIVTLSIWGPGPGLIMRLCEPYHSLYPTSKLIGCMALIYHWNSTSAGFEPSQIQHLPDGSRYVTAVLPRLLVQCIQCIVTLVVTIGSCIITLTQHQFPHKQKLNLFIMHHIFFVFFLFFVIHSFYSGDTHT